MKNTEKNSKIPTTYEELYTLYVTGSGSLCRQLLRTFLPTTKEDEREALAHDVFVRCLEKQVIEKYDPTKANFGGVIFYVTRTIVTAYLGKFQRSPIGQYAYSLQPEAEEEFEPGTVRLNQVFTMEQSAEETLDKKSRAQKVEAVAKRDGARNAHKRDRSLAPTVSMLEQGFEVKEIAEALHVTVSTIHNWMNYLAQEAQV